MRLLGQTSRVYKGTEYKKHWIVIPNSLVKKLGWKVGQELEADVKDKKLVVKKD
jgi:bifunctional DNA-binding transcriptional regulator/antitoxin component of YhaV-PrlF toxin-antitoxin module